MKNEGSEPHQALVVRLPEGVSEFGERAWFEHGSKGPEPGERVGGLETLAPGAEASFRTDLKPGKYLLLCAMSEDEGRHYELGMIYRFDDRVDRGQGTNVNLTWPVIVLVSPRNDPPSGRVRVVTRT